MAIESDRVEILSGVRRGLTLGTPVALLVRNKDWVNWQWTMAVGEAPAPDAGGARRPPVTRPRPGHADLAGALKYGHHDLRDVLERASARETAARVAVGGCGLVLLERFGIRVASYVRALGSIHVDDDLSPPFEAIAALDEDDPIRCVDARLREQMIAAIDRARAAGDTLGGCVEVIANGVPAGLGSYAQWDRRLDGRLAQALMSIPAIKAVEIGAGVRAAGRPGSQVHDAILPAADPAHPERLSRPTNRAGGIEGGVSNGEDIRVTAYMKPIATLMSPLSSVDLATGHVAPASVERSDVCAVPAAAVVCEAMVALVIAQAFLETFGGDSVADIERNFEAWRRTRASLFAAARGVAGKDPAPP
jgi:chorismate synthase